MNKYILIEVNNNIKRFINKCKNYNIELYSIDYINKDKIIVKINNNDYELIKRYNYYSEINIYSKLGISYYKDKIYKQKYFILFFIICLITMYLISNIIVKVNIIHSNINIRKLVSDELEEYGIKKFSYKKDFNELDEIKTKILENNKDSLEWISITNVGMTYVVRIEERIKTEITTTKEYCNIVSSKEALITNIYGTSGEIIVSVNDIVKKDDILINGNITLNDENKGYICANGKVMGQVWYTTTVSLNRTYLKKEYTGNTRYNFTINKKILRNTKYNKYDKKYLVKTRFFTLYKELEYNTKEYKYNEVESLEKALLEVDNKFKTKLGSDGKIISKKVLSKYINDKTISLSVFVITDENISKQVILSIPNTSDINS